MDFILFERYGLIILVIEEVYGGKFWTLEFSEYKWNFFEGRPLFSQLVGMKSKRLKDKEAIEMLRKYATDTVRGVKVRKFLDDYNKLPF